MKYFNSNETLNYCDVKITQEGNVEITPQSYQYAQLERLGRPQKTIRGRLKMVNNTFRFDPYAEASRKPTYQKQVVVGSTTLATTEDKVKISFMVPRHLTKPLMLLYIQSEIDEVKRRLDVDVYDSLVVSHKNDNDNGNADAGGASVATAEALASLRSATSSPSCHPDGKVNVSVNVNVEKKGGKA